MTHHNDAWGGERGRRFTEKLEVQGTELVQKVKDLAKESNTRSVVIKNSEGQRLATVPLGWGLAGGAATLVLAPVLGAVAVIGGAVAKVRLEIERQEPAAGPNGQVIAPDGMGAPHQGGPGAPQDTPGWPGHPGATGTGHGYPNGPHA